MSLSTPQILAQLERVLGSDPKAVAVAIRAGTRESWPDRLSQGDKSFALRWCESSLAIREALCELDGAERGTSGIVIVTPLATHEIADDIAARIARARIFQPEAWDTVRQLFQAKEMDARLGRYTWMPDLLLESAAERPYPLSLGGVLDLEAAWREVLQRCVGLDSARPDAIELLRWSSSPSAEIRLGALPDAARADVLRWLSDTAGAAGPLIVACIEAGCTADAAPLGLVCGVIFGAASEGEIALGQAAIRLERFVNDRHVDSAGARSWAAAAEQCVRLIGLENACALLDRADALLEELRIDEFAHLGELSPKGLDQRLRRFASALDAHVVAPTEASRMAVEQLGGRVAQHALLTTQTARRERVRMAVRLARWLTYPAPIAADLATAAAWQADHGAFVDWARFRLLGGDELSELAEAYARCRDAVIARRDAFAQAFAQALLGWNKQPPAVQGRAIPVEAIIERVAAPLAEYHPVLLLVMDGLSVSIFRELFDGIGTSGWSERIRKDLAQPLIGVAAIPTITEISRASLLCGRLTAGSAPQEKAGFGSHAALALHCHPSLPPRLFHKGELSDATNLSPDTRAAIANPKQKVVGVVYNAVDDHLGGPEQAHQHWDLQHLRLLLPVLREARAAKRVVIVTADHGHLLEDGTRQVAVGSSDRWRTGADANPDHEIEASGARVLTPDGAHTAVCLWGERTRYAGRKNGYHGGLSPQEVTVPLSVFAPLDVSLADWMPAPPLHPEWWEASVAARYAAAPQQPAAVARPQVAKRRAAVSAGQTELFDTCEPVPAPVDGSPDWVAALLTSDAYASQRQLAARVALPDDQMRLLLTALSERGGKLSRAALAQRLSLPEMRLGGLLSAARRMLNVDQAQVLTVDDSSQSVELNQVLLEQQFGLTARGARP